jgi:hypothetical protein
MDFTVAMHFKGDDVTPLCRLLAAAFMPSIDRAG